MDKHYRGHNYRADIMQMNSMYGLPTSSLPSILPVYRDEQRRAERPIETIVTLLDSPLERSVAVALTRRLIAFKHTLSKELEEIEQIIEGLLASDENKISTLREFLVSFVDLLVDLGVYVASERQKFGLQHAIFDSIVMWSNQTKLGADGKPIHDEHGKFLKGPNFQPPEPALSRVLEESFAHLYNQDFALGQTYTPDWKMTPGPERQVHHLNVGDAEPTDAEVQTLIDMFTNAGVEVVDGKVTISLADFVKLRKSL